MMCHIAWCARSGALCVPLLAENAEGFISGAVHTEMPLPHKTQVSDSARNRSNAITQNAQTAALRHMVIKKRTRTIFQ